MDPQFQMQAPFEVMRAQMEQFQATFQRTLEETTRFQQNMLRLFEDMQRQLTAFWPQVQGAPWHAMTGGQQPDQFVSWGTASSPSAPKRQGSGAQGQGSRRRAR